MAQNHEKSLNPLESLGSDIASLYLQQKLAAATPVRDGMLSGDSETVSSGVEGLKTVLDDAKVLREKIEESVASIRGSLGSLPSLRFSFMIHSGPQRDVVEAKQSPVVIEASETVQAESVKMPPVKEPVVSAEPLGFFVQEVPSNSIINQIEPAIIVLEPEPEPAIETVQVASVATPPTAETDFDEFVFDLESDDDDIPKQATSGSQEWVDRRQFVPEAGELTFKADHMPATYVTTLAKAIIDAYRAGTLVDAGVNLRRIDLSAIQRFIGDEELAELKKLSSDARDDVMYGIVEKLMDYSKNPTRTLQDELGHDGYLLLDLLGPSIRSKSQVLDLMDALPFESETDFRALYGSTRRPQTTTVSQKPRKLSKAQLDRQVAGGDTRLTQRQINAFNRQTSESTRKKGKVSPEAQAARELLENIESTIVYKASELLVANKTAGVAERGDSRTNVGVLEAVANAYRNQSWFILENLERTASGLVILSPNKQLLDYWKGDRRLGIQDNIQYSYQVFLQGEVPDVVNIERDVARTNGSDLLTVISSPLDRMKTVLGSNVRLQMQITPKEIFANVIGKKVTQAELVLSGTDQQARAILAAHNIPIVGDSKYAPDVRGVTAPRPMIHAEKVRLIDPKTKQPFPEIVADLPGDFAEFKNRLSSIHKVS